MKYVEAPNLVPDTLLPNSHSIFLAGGITGCVDWQYKAARALSELDITVYNPRREHFDVSDPTAAETQIGWEHMMLRNAGAILFHFSPETLNPIVLYELGRWVASNKPLFISCPSTYKRFQDVIMQVRLERPWQIISPDLDCTLQRVITHFKHDRAMQEMSSAAPGDTAARRFLEMVRAADEDDDIERGVSH